MFSCNILVVGAIRVCGAFRRKSPLQESGDEVSGCWVEALTQIMPRMYGLVKWLLG
ncbi:MAG: hypothetical protein F6K40_06365 [Okeania sp. SIO3I5]|uniref:hypothetical protein n=1 Tax=Okeania sp. SIO3I5 TaxID=2607805 RepID=UPI0013B6831D|nr:hypothetical protein [Okeania sp. SIO3I5]NEQ35929.1 hypothetical protein [Okeania sp. SIO3I5]